MATVSRPNQDVIRPDKDSALLAEGNPFEAMMSRFDYAAQRLSLDPGLYKVLRSPEKQIIVSVPIHRDNGEVEVYTGSAHGWCPPDSAVYNEPQAEKAWSRLLALYGKALA